MNCERNVSVEEPSGETLAEMQDSRMGQGEKLSSQGPQAGPLHFLRTCGCMWAAQRRGMTLVEGALFGRGQSL